MKSIVADLQDQVVSIIEDGVTDAGGDQHMIVELIHTDDELALADYVADHERRIGEIPHAFVFAGTLTFQRADSSGFMQTLNMPVRTFVATRDASTNDQEIQHRKASKWSIYVAAAISGGEVRMTGTNTAYLEDPNVEVIVNTERSSIWEVRYNVRINLDTEIILNEIDNE